ncbi:hypothetical protein BABINDRAFT_141735 [Babjeviella inositovora NRRL Y-12698]|uniref:Uncharacterized protein n=1 Tax=Babjeviella inositovora NRRL Y-12698 TaxID=984486 RepID=A0A1E3QNS1_9ASCO|nr:uncharacterized protein BABINDRAFT_141735 [Babjeviella inositovora NRRL Y-12698]ODQ79356.1 hypothetical protein BABINDRAFT_141735 [Babjeviella inositovora NRRL Y-12698]
MTESRLRTREYACVMNKNLHVKPTPVDINTQLTVEIPLIIDPAKKKRSVTT